MMALTEMIDPELTTRGIGSRLAYADLNPRLEIYIMNKDQAGGNWKQFKGKAKEQWGKLTDDDITVIEGKRDQLVGKIQERYGYEQEKAEKEVNDWESRHKYHW
ncbi:CsbD family protein [Brenneria sp. EniD312]|nr:CsbD family protein [Brenneria sp. EniD312]